MKIYDFVKGIELTQTKHGYYCEDMINENEYPNLEALGISCETSDGQTIQ